MSKQYFAIRCLISSWVFGSVGLLLGILYTPEWFGRFGSMIVLFAVMSEYSLLQLESCTLYKALKGQGAAECGNTGIPDLSPPPWHKTQVLMSHITVIVGTLIWGFGDKFIKWNP